MNNDLKEIVRAKYNAIADSGDSCCGSDCCAEVSFVGETYDDLAGHVDEADLGLGCGLPTRGSGIKEGDYVVDLGSGAGNDVFVARAIVGETGRVVGIDMADSMLARACTNAEKQGFDNVFFHKGDIENIPLPDGKVDVVISNCVFNLVPDKRQAFSETLRILRPGGHFSISDIVTIGELPEGLRSSAEMYAGCVAGALDMDEYLGIIRDTGFANIEVRKQREIVLDDALLREYLSPAQILEFRNSNAGIYSITVAGTKET